MAANPSESGCATLSCGARILRGLEDRLPHQQSGCARRARRKREPLVPQRGALRDGQLTVGLAELPGVTWSGLWLLGFNLVVKAFAESLGHLVFDTITHQLH